jgi:hypothetical protein
MWWLPNCRLTSSTGVVLRKLIVAQLVQQFPASFGTLRVHKSHSKPHELSTQLTAVSSILILSSHLHLGLHSSLSSSFSGGCTSNLSYISPNPSFLIDNCTNILCQSRWLCGLRRRSRLLGYWDRGFEYRSRYGCSSLCLLVYVVLSCVGTGLCDGLITCPKESYQVS